ncbi:WAT1-related protein At2g37460-like [Trifolium pratense]|uniref:WAT1-related protein At2g37460-like n=1 Tax=Trifolium pratense TaxID=57577 RepID=UPI001E697E39|nr:WAT1-related protein At2g37460-like [Trifolium pratense]
MNILMKLAINNGISNYVFVVYRSGVASLFMGPIGFFVARNISPAMTSRIFRKIIVLSLLGIILVENIYYAGMKLTTSTFATALSNTIPTITFVLAIIFRIKIMDHSSPQHSTTTTPTPTTNTQQEIELPPSSTTTTTPTTTNSPPHSPPPFSQAITETEAFTQ